MRQHILRELPEEACGIVGGREGTSKTVFEIKNVLKSPVRFRMEPGEQVRAFLEMERLGMDLLAIYHSHPRGPSEPSQTDLEEFTYPGTPYLIWYPEGEDWTCQAFLLSSNGTRKIPYLVVE